MKRLFQACGLALIGLVLGAFVDLPVLAQGVTTPRGNVVSATVPVGPFTVGTLTTAGNATTTINDAISVTGSTNFITSIGTFPASASGAIFGALLNYTSATGSGAAGQSVLRLTMNAGYNGSGDVTGLNVLNSAAGTGVAPLSTQGNFAGRFNESGSSTGNNVGSYSVSTNSSTINYGAIGAAVSGTNSPANNVGGTFLALNSTNPIGVFGALQNVATLPAVTAAGVFSNASTANDNICAYDGTLAACSFSIGDEGNIKHSRTVTAGGTTGNQTINKPVGTVNFAAAATAITVTNSLVSATSIIFTTIRTADATCTAVKSVVPGAGSFVMTLNAGCTAETSVGFMVTN